MSLYALADLHLPANGNKPMDIFGDVWREHSGKIERCWRETVGEDDAVLIPGDISWAMRLEEARGGLSFVEALPERKIFVRGNHDYWWSSEYGAEYAVFGHIHGEFGSFGGFRAGNCNCCLTSGNFLDFMAKLIIK